MRKKLLKNYWQDNWQDYLKSNFQISFNDLYEYDGLCKIDKKFASFLEENNSAVNQKFLQLKANKERFTASETSDLIIEVAIILENFLAKLFNIEQENLELQKKHQILNNIYKVRRDFVQREVAKKFLFCPDDVDGKAILHNLEILYDDIDDLERKLADRIIANQNLEDLTNYTLWAIYSEIGKKFHKNGALFIVPKKIDRQNLIAQNHNKSNRSGFDLTDLGFNLNRVLGEANYCIFCHKQQKDSCKTGIVEKTNFSTLHLNSSSFNPNSSFRNPSSSSRNPNSFSSHTNITHRHSEFPFRHSDSPLCHPERSEGSQAVSSEFLTQDPSSSPQDDKGENHDNKGKAHEEKQFKKDELGVELHGCPLDEKISEMNLLKSAGFSIAALATAVIDNPMIAGTGHRICNDCTKSCIYQKQDAVDIPQIETRTLKDVLNLPYGFEIYSLLTRWNPLNIENNLPQKKSGKKILVAGLGPAGYTLAHYFLNSGHEVIAIDGLKIEPLNKEISGVDQYGNFCDFKPIKFLDEIYEPLSKRLINGFGGVAEYGITVRFDKNFLKVIRLLLERRKNFRMFGGIRFGSSITDKTAFENYGFDHIALCIGAGRPNIINLKNNFAKGVRQASDFLMSLQLTGSFKENLFTNLQIRMPIIVIGGGLTAVDTACEAKSYYVVQVKKFAKKVSNIGKEKLFAVLNEEEKIIAEEFLNHAQELENGDIDELMKKWGGVKIIYRKKIQDSPAYRLNHQELNKAMEEDIEFIENITPLEVEIDKFNHIKAVKCADNKSFECKALLVAAGTSPNLSPKLEDGLDFEINGKYFAEINKNHQYYPITHSAREKNFSVITKIDDKTKKAVSFFGDLHPNFEGNVVKAMASAKLGYKQVNQALELLEENKNDNFLENIKTQFLVKIHKIDKLSDFVYQISIHAPLLAQHSQIGHIFRLQNYHALAALKNDNLMAMEGVAVTALNIDKVAGIISAIVVDFGGSTSLIKNFKEGEPCIFMGPSGKPTDIRQNETVLLIGGGRGNQPLTALAQAFKKNGCKVIFCAGYRKNSYIVNQELMEKFCDNVIFAIEEEEPILPFNNSNNIAIRGSVIDALKIYFAKNTEKIDCLFTIGNDKMMHEIAKLRHQNLVKSISAAKIAITSLNSPMQCMMKGVCSQCLQKRLNEKGEEEYFYSCANQDQDMDKFDFNHLHNRCEQNSVMEKLVKLDLLRLSN